MLEDDPDGFAEMARELSVDEDTRYQGGYIGKVRRGALEHEVEAKLFNAEPGALFGPFASDGDLLFEIYRVDAKHPARLDDSTNQEVAKMVYDDWIKARSQEHILEVV